MLVLGAKSVVAVMLLAAGGAKLADLASFAVTVRLFLPRGVPRRVRGGAAVGIAVAEVVIGGASLSFPAVRWLNLVVFAAAGVFVLVSVAGFVFYRGQSCRCFGALSQRKFDAAGIVRSLGIATLAAFAMSGVPPESIRLGIGARILLLTAMAIVGFAAFTAAGAVAVSRETLPGLAQK